MVGRICCRPGLYLNHEAQASAPNKTAHARRIYERPPWVKLKRAGTVGKDDKTQATVTPIGEGKKKRGRPKKSAINPITNENELLTAVRLFLHPPGDNWLDPPIECIAPTGAFKTLPTRTLRAKTKSKSALFRRAKALGAIPQHLPQSKDAFVGALEFIAEQEYASAWLELNDKINTYKPWPKGYDPYHKLIYAIGAEAHRTDSELYKDIHCGLRHFFMQIKRVVAAISTKDDYPIVLAAWGNSGSGKSWLFKMIFRVIFGDWFALDNFRLLQDEFRQKRAGQLPLILMDEMEKVGHTDRDAFKNFISSNSLMCRVIFTDDVVDDDNIASIACITNNPPPFGLYDESSGIARRVLPFECHAKKYRERSDEVLTFTEEDALALVTGLPGLEDDIVIWNERAESLAARQEADMREDSFEKEWLHHCCIPYVDAYDAVSDDVQQKRRWNLTEVIESMADYKHHMGDKRRLVKTHRIVRKNLNRIAGVDARKRGNDFYLVSHARRTKNDPED